MESLENSKNFNKYLDIEGNEKLKKLFEKKINKEIDNLKIKKVDIEGKLRDSRISGLRRISKRNLSKIDKKLNKLYVKKSVIDPKSMNDIPGFKPKISMKIYRWHR